MMYGWYTLDVADQRNGIPIETGLGVGQRKFWRGNRIPLLRPDISKLSTVLAFGDQRRVNSGRAHGGRAVA
jgi:hypothetical protein